MTFIVESNVDLFTRTFLPAAADAGLPMPAIARHLPLVRSCLGTEDAVLMVTQCDRPDRPRSGEHLLVLTRNRLVVTHERRLGHRVRLHIDAPIHELSQVAWHPDTRRGTVELVATAIDGIRERFWIKARHPKAIGLVDSTLGLVFRAAWALSTAGRAGVPASAA